jgi:hypothetical protein
MSSTQSNKHKAAQWFCHVEQWRASGQTRSCQQHGLTVHAFGYWITRHRTQVTATGNNALTLIPAKVIAPHGEVLPAVLILVCPNGSMPTTTPAWHLAEPIAMITAPSGWQCPVKHQAASQSFSKSPARQWAAD